MDRDENNNHGVTCTRRNRIFDFLSKVYAMVDDPSTDSIISWEPNGESFIVWKPLEYSRELLTGYLRITTLARLRTYGFSKIVGGEGQEVFSCNDFVRGKPELLEKIVELYVAKLKATEEKWLKSCRKREELNLAFKQHRERSESRKRKLNLLVKDLDEGRVVATQAIDHFMNLTTNLTIPDLKNYINQENNIQKLQVAINLLNEINNGFSDLKKSIDGDGSNLITSSLHNFHL